MYSTMIRTFLIVACTVAAASIGNAQQSAPAGQGIDIGKQEYDGHCAACHGLSGEGEGPYSGYINKTIPNLTSLAKRNGGVFPFARVYEIIDGRQVRLFHGTKEMPIWGPRYKAEAEENSYNGFRFTAEVFVRARILALTEYIYRLQAKQ